jgi:nucleotide-binding universal stress UspA family protein
MLRLTLREFVTSVAGNAPVSVRVTSGADVRRVIVTEVETDDADLLVIGTHGRGGLERFLLGSTSDRLVRQAGCPVLVVPPDAEPPRGGRYSRVLCGIDFSPASLRAFRYALNLASAGNGEVRLLHAIEMPPELRDRQIAAALDVDAVRMAAEKAARQRLEALSPGADAPPVRSATQVVEGRAHRQLLEIARQEGADLIVLGTRGRGAVDRWLFGSNTQAVLHDAPCAVLTVRPE